MLVNVVFVYYPEGCDWVWDKESKSSSASLSCSERMVSFHSEYSCGTAAVRGSRALSDGQHFWEIKMTSPVYGTDIVSSRCEITKPVES